MKDYKYFDVIIVGGSYSGLAAAMALGRALREVLIIDGEKPCNIQTPYSHNFITQDGSTPKEISSLAKKQVEKYATVTFFKGIALKGIKTENGFEIETESGERFWSRKLIFATGIRDIFPDIEGYAACWGISLLHCPYCHGYEIKNRTTGIVSNGETGFDFCRLISNWTKDLILFTNGQSTLTTEQKTKLECHSIQIVEKEIDRLDHRNGYIQNIIFKDNTNISVEALYTHNPFEQHCSIPHDLGCEITDDGYIKIDAFQKTSIPGIFACGDNTSKMRTVANSVAMGTTAGMMLNREFVLEEF